LKKRKEMRNEKKIIKNKRKEKKNFFLLFSNNFNKVNKLIGVKKIRIFNRIEVRKENNYFILNINNKTLKINLKEKKKI